MIVQPTAETIPTTDPLELTFGLSEIFHSVQGEGLRAGERCVFVRLQGCKLRCSWCDTPYALDSRYPERAVTGQQILEEVASFDCPFVEFTGGEPLEQFGVMPLMSMFCDAGYTVAIETGGHIDVSFVDERVIRIIDMKCPDSKMMPLNRYENLNVLRPHDEVKFVIASRRDYEWARDLVQEHNLTERTAVVLFSTVFDKLTPVDLVGWILEDRLNVRFQLQLHKFIWNPSQRGV